MIYIVFDTNIWVYLANGYDSEKENYYQGVFSEHHFDLLEILKKKVDNGDFKILVNDLFFKEWERNKHTTEALINFLELRMREILKSGKLIKAFISQEDFISQKVLTEKAIKAVNIKIERNKKHIQEVEDFLENECIKISISDEVLKKVSLLAMEKNVAPFLNDKKNNVPDAVILYSSVEYLADKLSIDESRGIFVSNNYKDFASTENKDVFHPDIRNGIGDLELTYERHLTKVVGLSEELQEDIEYFLDRKREILEESHFYCQSPFCQENENYYPGGYFGTKIRVTESIEEFEDPNQLKLFPFQDLKIDENEKMKSVNIGNCDTCGTVHICCPECNSLMIDVDDLGEHFCRECEMSFQIKFSQRNKDNVIIKKA
jgi:hypothetical protein